jgi:hypothetical protein
MDAAQVLTAEEAVRIAVEQNYGIRSPASMRAAPSC